MTFLKRFRWPTASPGWVDTLASLLASILLGTLVPWKALFRATTLCGGDNPAHPVLMKSIGESFFSHGSLIHYSYRFWGGFEAFQYYFPLPYLSGAILAKVIHPGIAFKFITLFGILALPMAFYSMAADLRFSRTGRVCASILSLPFLFTKAHVMWGGNIFSALAGMIGNAWGFVFLVVAFGKIFKAHQDRTFSSAALLFCVLAALSHFYALLILATLFGAIALFDAGQWLIRRRTPPFPLYAAGVISVILMAWWILPLFYYARFSSDLGGNWDIQLLKTFTTPEKVAFGLSILVGIVILIRTRLDHTAYAVSFLFLGVALFYFFFNRLFNTSVLVFLDVRLWPSIYFGLYFLILLSVETLYQTLPHYAFPFVLASLCFLIPAKSEFTKTTFWMDWNFRGIESSIGWSELKSALASAEKDPTARISYEANGRYADRTFGSVRAMELLPYLTHHELMLGGIVNSASYAGIGYFLQCFLSKEGAGWPPGSVMPHGDIGRGIDFMNALGIPYHIAFDPALRKLWDERHDVEKIHDGTYLAVYKLKGPVSMVDVYPSPLPVYVSPQYRSALLNLPRWDVTRHAGLIYQPTPIDPSLKDNPVVRLEPFVNLLVDEWNRGRRTFDMGWQKRQDRIHNKLNLFLFSRGAAFDPNHMDTTTLEFFIADRGFDPQLYILKGQKKYTEVAMPLLRSQPGLSTLIIHGKGYRVFANGLPVPLEESFQLSFTPQRVGSDKAPFVWLIFKPEGPYQYAEVFSTDPALQSRLPGSWPRPELPMPLTEGCQVSLEKQFHQMVLHTSCPGKPHLIKYSYFPKWTCDVSIHIGTNGFMVLTPKQETTVLVHKSGRIDHLGQVITGLAGLALATFWFIRRKHALPS